MDPGPAPMQADTGAAFKALARPAATAPPRQTGAPAIEPT